MAMVLNNIGMSFCERGEYQRAFQCVAEGEKIARAADIRETTTRLSMLKAWILQIRKEYPAAIRLLKETIGLAEKYGLETQRIWATKQFIETAIEANDRKHLAGISKHAALIEKAYRHEPFGKNKGLLLAALIDFDRFTRDYARARKKLAVLQGIVRELKDPGLTIESLLVAARLNRATGREYRSLVIKGKKLCRELDLVTLRNEFDLVMRK
jgi:tetratricopeptide (TPR) repeat protein